MKSVSISCYLDPKGQLLAAVVSGHGRNEIRVLSIEKLEQLESKIEFQAEEKVQCVRWIPRGSTKSVGKNGSKKRKQGGKEVKEGSSEYSYLSILLTTGEILVYSPLTKEITNKMSNESPLSCICYGGSESTIIGFDPANSTLKKYNLFDSRPLDTSSIKLEKDISFIELINDRELVLASSNIHLYNEEEGQTVFTIPAPKAHQSPISQLVKSVKNDRLIAASRSNDLTINIASLDTGKLTTTLRCQGRVMSLAVTQSNGVELLLAVTDRGCVEIFKDAFDQKSRKQIRCDAVLKSSTFGFTDIVVEATGYRAVYFDNFKIKVKLLEISDLGELEGEVEVDLADTEGDANGANGANGASVNGADTNGAATTTTTTSHIDSTDSDNSLLDSMPEIEDFQQLYEQIVNHLDNHEVLEPLLVKNCGISRSTTYLFSNSEALKLVKIIVLLLSEQSKYSADLGKWLRWLLLCKGSLLVKDSECVELLKLLKSTLTENIKLLPNLISLQGRLSLLQSQLKLREEMIHKEQIEEQNEEKIEAEADAEQDAIDGSVVLHGENDELEDVKVDINDEEVEDDD
ncbi:hypothetical protein FOA43_002038 [Brettanomyces nanus]|uniref:Small-subunit processome Utp12 domain-containing protein n=1 Tax=Eeniella nana TaxID=13502 RepID=A0A875S2X4_EENNA|nr:uncharacterized protein FOA43_002038 [Brettanomyces nanus]QPG74705.1 hypothetical protein FOA43_002038 [Brettanomyces nanus]